LPYCGLDMQINIIAAVYCYFDFSGHVTVADVVAMWQAATGGANDWKEGAFMMHNRLLGRMFQCGIAFEILVYVKYVDY